MPDTGVAACAQAAVEESRKTGMQKARARAKLITRLIPRCAFSIGACVFTFVQALLGNVMLIQPLLRGIQNLPADFFPKEVGYPAAAKSAPGYRHSDSHCYEGVAPGGKGAGEVLECTSGIGQRRRTRCSL